MIHCQICQHAPLNHVLSLGYMPPVNWMAPIDQPAKEETWMPTDLFHCPKCELVQLGFIGDSEMVFPAHYPYTSGSTKLLVDNFDQQAEEAIKLLNLKAGDLVIDIGSNDGTLLAAYKRRGMRVFGVEPTDIAKIANQRGIETEQAFFDELSAQQIRTKLGEDAALITCCNCFAHIPDVHGVVRGIKQLLKPGGTFLSESHYLISLLNRMQYDTIYHEHLRYYSLTSLNNLFHMHNLQIIAVKKIPTHGGSIRVYAADSDPSYGGIDELQSAEQTGDKMLMSLKWFADNVLWSKLHFINTICRLKKRGRIVGIGAPSRASTVISYCRLDRDLIEYVCERPGSLKIGRYMPGTRIPVVDEERIYREQPEAAVIFSWHLFDEIKAKLRDKGYHGEIVSPIG